MSEYPALSRQPVTERHARICAERGHASHLVDSVDSGVCPRCGEVKLSTPHTGLDWSGETFTVTSNVGLTAVFDHPAAVEFIHRNIGDQGWQPTYRDSGWLLRKGRSWIAITKD